MKKAIHATAFILLLAATTALAHQDVRDATVKARMGAMSVIGKNTKILGTMAKGQVAFDAQTARAAAAVIADHAAQISTLFLDPATDPKSEALPVIWASYGDFSAKADALKTAALSASQNIAAPADLRPALAAIGGACKSCHQTYRK